MQGLITGAIRLYQLAVAPWLGPCCRFYPSCSQYARQAVAEHGCLRGLWLAGKRLLKCQPFHPGGYDPVPQRAWMETPRTAESTGTSP
jgi:putative membrane protein insertion efficiency factor